MSNLTTDNFKEIVLQDIPLIDVRAPIEFIKGAFETSINMPILSDDERHIIGTCYKEHGNETATALGYKLVSGDIKQDRVNSWISFINQNPETMIYCFRGGSRSTIAQKWIYEASDKKILKLDGGYKAFRNYLINSFTEETQNLNPITLAGYTGSGKTILLNQLDNSIDLEGIANHRGSSFGNHISPQPTQIGFENKIAFALIKHNDKGYKNVVIEDEGRNIGRNFIPLPLTQFFNSGDLVILDISLEDRITNTLNEYVIAAQAEYIDAYGIEIGLENWFKYIYESMNRVKRKLGGDKFNIVLDMLKSAYDNQISTGDYHKHRIWIELFLRDYYDPMYNFGLNKTKKNIIFKGNSNEVLSYLKSIK